MQPFNPFDFMPILMSPAGQMHAHQCPGGVHELKAVHPQGHTDPPCSSTQDKGIGWARGQGQGR
jgi:hypothetical protein